MELDKRSIIAIAVVVVLVAGIAGFNWYQGQQSEKDRLEQEAALLEARRAKWETWSRTMRIGTSASDFHPGINLGSGDADTLQRVLLGTRPLWTDQLEFTPGVTFYNPLVAEGWVLKTAADGQEYIEFKLNPGLKFTDGTPLDAEAIKFCWEQERYDLPFREQHAYTGCKWWHENAWERLECPDSLTLQMYLPPFTAKRPYGGFLPMAFCALFNFRCGIVYSPTSTELYAKETDPIESFVNQAGFGPFILDKWVPDERFELVPWDEYPVNPLGPYGGPSRCTTLDRVIITAYPDPISLRMALETAEIDATAGSGLSRSDFADLRDNYPNIITEYTPYLGSQNNLHMNLRPEYYPLNDTRVRKAIAYAIFPEEITEKLFFGTGDAADTPVRPIQAYYKPVFRAIRDLPREERFAKARELLAEAGLPDGFSTELWYPSGSGSEFGRDMGTIVQSQLSEIGITVELKMIENAIYYDFRSSGRLPMFFRGWTLDYIDADSEIFYMMHSSSSYLTQPLGFNNSRVDELLNLGRELYDPRGPEFDPPKRAEIYEELQDYILENGFCVPLYYAGFYDAKNDWVKGWEYWNTCDIPYQGVWAASKEIPDDWETHDPPF